ncbi:ethanolamine utilization protein EutP [Arachnia propionica]|uniref:Ethanolamine utilization protein EutP n=1 Tax=Arachnia propionica TaxID=1750 RepID=A0A3P1T2A4_9ACTN|nr:EutP/PduV family microcompartment system protein [Arachnia propionica]MDO5084061.1 EutP/PduV family microcompartment system protein [Arachnia propionica]RRD03415.1 ethanolamine utilization protein EutP [Arachnia propionica]
MRNILLVGSIGAGKTTFRQRLQGLPIEYAKTQAIETFGSTVDTPGEYLEVGRYKHALMLASYDVDTVVLIQAADNDDTRYPPGFASSFNREVLGVVTKTGLASPAQIEQAVAHLQRAGATPILTVDSITGDGFDEVAEALCATT